MKTTFGGAGAPPKLPYIDPDWCAEIIASQLRREEQPDGQARFWMERFI